ncbi:MAG TPA: hypothetical protein VF304_13865 [Casimicrobiaceae bacterium]
MHARRHDVVTIPTIRLAFVLSLLVHAALLWLVWPQLRSLTQAREHDGASSLAVELVPRKEKIASAAPPPSPPSPPIAAVVPQRPVEAKPPPRKPTTARPPPPRRPPPVIAQRAPAPAIAPPPLPPRAAPPLPAPNPAPVAPPLQAPPTPPAVAPAQDLASYVAARRAARGEAPETPAAPSASTESDTARRDRIVAANLGLNRTPTFGNDTRSAGGLFQITEIGYDDARFYFFGFDKAIGRNARQLIEVRKGDAPDIRIAMVRKMIAIIRENVSGDFVWVSRFGSTVTLSARPGDAAGLEDYILRDVFPDARLP